MNTAEPRVSNRVVVQSRWTGTDLKTMRLTVRQEIVKFHLVWLTQSLFGDEPSYGRFF
jgi:hypothetical protein